MISNNQGGALQSTLGDSGVGGLRVDEFGNALLSFCTITGNQAGPTLFSTQSSGVGGVGRPISTIPLATRLTMESCIAWGNFDATGMIADLAGTAPQIQASYSNLGGGWPGIGNIDATPLFLAGTTKLGASSPCIDAGLTATAPIPEIDIDGDPRRFYSALDMGADEYVSECFTGTVGEAQGAPQRNLQINGADSPLVRIATGQAIEIRVLQPSTNPNPAHFLVFGAIGRLSPAEELPTGIGTLCFLPSVASPDPRLFLLASSFAPSAGFVGATPTPWSWTRLAGLSLPATVSFQGVIVQSAGGGQNLGITNGMIVEVF